jgi:hypothetical protein
VAVPVHRLLNRTTDPGMKDEIGKETVRIRRYLEIAGEMNGCTTQY